MANKIRSYK